MGLLDSNTLAGNSADFVVSEVHETEIKKFGKKRELTRNNLGRRIRSYKGKLKFFSAEQIH